jgi:Ni/Fe-hydrogenase subunit HybB-like protein
MSHNTRPLGGPILTDSFRVVLFLSLTAFAIVFWRLIAGLGPTTALSDGYPWGIWIAFDVVTGTALACGGYAVAIMCYVLNKGQYHPLVRPAILTSALGYTIAGVSVVIDVGRYWLLYGVFMPWRWNLNSVLLEVALCITAYIFVLWIEFSPVFLHRLAASGTGRLADAARKVSHFLDRGLVFILALGMLLPTMHQSSLGSLMLVAGNKLHGFWHTPWLPLLFLSSCMAMGYAIVAFESLLGSISFRRPAETKMLRSLAKVTIGLQLFFLALRFVDLGFTGKLSGFVFDKYGILLIVETLLFLLPIYILMRGRQPAGNTRLFLAAVFLLFAGALYRFDTYLIAFDPGQGWSYFPSISETMVTLGFAATEVAIYVALVKRFPVLTGPEANEPALSGA